MLKQREIISIMINAIFMKMILTFPRNAVIRCGNSAWMEILLSTLFVILIFFITASVYKSKKNIIELAECFGGRALRAVTGILTFAVLLSNFIPIFRIFPESVKIILLQDTRTEVIMIVFIAAAAIGAYFGIEAIARIHCIILPAGAAVLTGFLLFLIPYYNIENITPIFGKGYDKIFFGGFNSLSLYSDLILLNIFLPSLKNYGTMKKSGYKSLIASGTASVVLTLAYCLTYQNPASEEFILPAYQLSRIIHLSSFFSRFEALFHSITSIMMFLYAALYVYAISYVIGITFGVKRIEPLIIPVAVISYVLMIIPSSFMDMIEYSKRIYAAACPLAFIMPVLYGVFLKKGYKNEAD